MNSANLPAARRWRTKFSLRALLVVLTALCIWLGVIANRARRQEEALKAIQAADGIVYFSYQLAPVDADPDRFYLVDNAAPLAPPWLRRMVGEDYFRTVTTVELNNRNLTQADLAQLEKLPRVNWLSLTSAKVLDEDGVASPVSDADLESISNLKDLGFLQIAGNEVHGSGLEHLVGLDRLWHLDLGRCKIDDAAMKHIGKLPGLRELEIEGSNVTDAGLRELVGLQRLEFVALTGSQVTDAGMVYLAQISSLKDLELRGLPITDAGMKSLGKRPWRHLDLRGCPIGDVGLEQLQSATGLETLYLSGTKITDAGLKYLQSIASLKDLALNGTAVTAEGVAKLQRSLPNARIVGP